MLPRSFVSSSSPSSSSRTWRKRWQTSWWNTPLHLRDTAVGVPLERMGAFCAIPREEWRSIVATVTLVVFLLGQCVLPATLALPYAQAVDPQKDKAAVSVGNKDEPKSEEAPPWITHLRARIAKDKQERAMRLAQAENENPAHHPRVRTVAFPRRRPLTLSDLIRVPSAVPGRVAVSPDNGACEDCEVDMRALDLSRTPTERELRRTGQLGGALSPTRPAEPLEVEGRLNAILKRAGIEEGLKANLPESDALDPERDRADKLLARAKKKAKRARRINEEFGAAMQEWNKHNYGVAAKMLDQHIKEFPDSPWAGEAILHLGCDAKYNGRFSEAQERYESLLNSTSSKRTPKNAEAGRPMRARSQAEAITRLNNQVEYITEKSKTPEVAVDHVDDTTDLSFEIHQKAKLRWADLDLAMGRFDSAAQKLGNIIQTDTDWRRKTWARHWLRNTSFYKKNAVMMMACGPQSLGIVLASLGREQAANRVRQAIAPRSNGFNLDELQTLAAKNGAAMRGFSINVSELSRVPLPAILYYDFGKSGMQTGGDERGAVTPFRAQNGTGHFVVLRSVDAKSRKVKVFDALEHRTYSMSFAQLQRQWSGKGLALQKGHTRLAQLYRADMKKAVGGCCGVPSKEDDLGDSPNNEKCKTCGGDHGEPVVEINHATLNMYVHDTPLWYEPATGPSVGITISYNSQDATTQSVPFGNKWMFNFGAYAVEDTGAGGGRVTVFMPDGAKRNYTPDGSGGYTNEPGDFSSLQKLSVSQYVITFQDGSKWEFSRPSGTTSLQVFLTRVVDRFGKALTLAYDTNVRLSTITDADGKVTIFQYNADGKVSSVWDPFNRHATFSYDPQGNLTQCVDMDGHVFSYVYDSEVRITQLNTAQGPWQFYHEAPDGINNGSNYYPAPGATMWEDSRLTVTNPAAQKEEYYYDGYHGVSWHVAHNDYQPNTGNGPSPVRTTYSFTVVGGKGRISNVASPDGTSVSMTYDTAVDAVKSFTDARNETTQIIYNSQGRPTQILPPAAVKDTTHANLGTKLIYDINNTDVLQVINANSSLMAEYTYDHHQPLTAKVYNNEGTNTTTYTYTPWGDVDSVTDPQNRKVQYSYGSDYRLASTTLFNASGSQTRATYTYDTVGRIKTVTDTSGSTLGLPALTTGYEYNNLDEVTKVTYPDTTTAEISYAGIGLPGIIKDRSGRYSYSDYDVLDRAVRTQDPQGESLLMDYDKNGNMTRLLDSNDISTKWTYDALNRVTAKTYPDGKMEMAAYSGGLLSQTANARQLAAQQVVTYGYDDNSNLTNINYPNANTPSVVFHYNVLDEVASISDGVGDNQTFNYDSLGRLNGLSGPFAYDNQTFGYDTYQRLQSQSVQNGTAATQSQSYTYDAFDRLSKLDSNGTNAAGSFDYSYVGNTDQLQSLTLGNHSVVQYGYDTLRRLTSLTNTNQAGYNLAKFSYALDNRDIRIAMGRTTATAGSGTVTANDAPQTVNYQYDATDQLVNETATKPISGIDTSVYSNRYIMDPMGNRIQWQKNRTQSDGSNEFTRTSYSPNALNQYTSQTTTVGSNPPQTGTFSYDDAGNLTQSLAADGSKSVYSYDDLDRLIAVTTYSTTNAPLNRSTNVYDYASRRAVSKISTWNSTTSNWDVTSEKRRVFNGMDVVQERDGNNQVRAQVVRDGGVGGILSRNTSTYGNTYYHCDGTGNVVALSDSQGALVGTYSYDAFGNVLDAKGTRWAENPYRFSSKELDGGTNLYDFGYRFYSPGMGRWINRDPIGEAGGLNLYAMVGNNPIHAVDVNGLLGVAVEFQGRTYTSPFYGYGGGDFLFDSGSSANLGSDLERGWDAGADGLNPFGDPYYDMGYYKTCDIGATGSFILGGVSREAMFAAVTPGSFATASGEHVFYAGAKGAAFTKAGLFSEAAIIQAGKAGRYAPRLLKDTVGGKILNIIDAGKGRVPEPVWKAASGFFAANTRKATVFLREPLRTNPIWYSTEEPILKFFRVTIIPK